MSGPGRHRISRLEQGPLGTPCCQVVHRQRAQGLGRHTNLSALARPEHHIAPRKVKPIGDAQTGEKRLHDRHSFRRDLNRLLRRSAQPPAQPSSQRPAGRPNLPTTIRPQSLHHRNDQLGSPIDHSDPPIRRQPAFLDRARRALWHAQGRTAAWLLSSISGCLGWQCSRTKPSTWTGRVAPWAPRPPRRQKSSRCRCPPQGNRSRPVPQPPGPAQEATPGSQATHRLLADVSFAAAPNDLVRDSCCSFSVKLASPGCPHHSQLNHHRSAPRIRWA
jgi:hypothetical protein